MMSSLIESVPMPCAQVTPPSWMGEPGCPPASPAPRPPSRGAEKSKGQRAAAPRRLFRSLTDLLSDLVEPAEYHDGGGLRSQHALEHQELLIIQRDVVTLMAVGEWKVT